ncbi:hypothetical protein EIP86_007005 [Pleurotus ostreatoroseus]|nr:hypothetical protein EIP86_007005 [Pleurotus ostreatoroseus]
MASSVASLRCGDNTMNHDSIGTHAWVRPPVVPRDAFVWSKVGAFVGTWTFPPMIVAFGGADTVRGRTGPFWIGSGLAVFSALTMLLLLCPLSHDELIDEDEKCRIYLEGRGYDTSAMGLMGTAAFGDDMEKIGDDESESKVPQL